MVPSPYELDHATAFVDSCAEGWASGERASFAVIDAISGEFFGSCGIKLAGAMGLMGYWVKREARRRGVATRACALVSDWALEQLRVSKLVLHAAVENFASQLVAERSGYRRHGTVNIAVRGEDIPHVEFSKTPAEL